MRLPLTYSVAIQSSWTVVSIAVMFKWNLSFLPTFWFDIDNIKQKDIVFIYMSINIHRKAKKNNFIKIFCLAIFILSVLIKCYAFSMKMSKNVRVEHVYICIYMHICMYNIYRRANGIYIPKKCNSQHMDSLSLFLHIMGPRIFFLLHQSVTLLYAAVGKWHRRDVGNINRTLFFLSILFCGKMPQANADGRTDRRTRCFKVTAFSFNKRVRSPL